MINNEVSSLIESINNSENIFKIKFNTDEMKKDKMYDKDLEKFNKEKRTVIFYSNENIPFNFSIEYSKLNPELSKDLYPDDFSFRIVKEYNLCNLLYKGMNLIYDESQPESIRNLIKPMISKDFIKNQIDFLNALKELDFSIELNKKFIKKIVSLLAVVTNNILVLILNDLGRLTKDEHLINKYLSGNLYTMITKFVMNIIVNISTDEKLVLELVEIYRESRDISLYHKIIATDINESTSTSDPLTLLTQGLFDLNPFGKKSI